MHLYDIIYVTGKLVCFPEVDLNELKKINIPNSPIHECSMSHTLGLQT